MRTAVVKILMGLVLLGAAPLFRPALAADAKWESLLSAVDPEKHAAAGTWKTTDGALHVDAAQGARLSLPVAPQGEYDFRVSFTRHTGVHSIALFFTSGAGQAAFEVDAWGQHLAGIQNISGKSFRENPTRRAEMELKNGQRYTMTVEVRKGEVRTLLDDEVVATHRTNGDDLSLPDVWAMRDKRSLGIGAWESDTTFHSIEARLVGGGPLVVAQSTAPAPAPKTPATTSKTPGRTSKSAATTKTPPATRPQPASKAPGGKRVLIVIANYHFFYREYGDPRAELERAGIHVTVAAGRRGPCQPHQGSGQGPDGGVVQAELAVADAKADDYDAILFSGGWGASAYQYAFNGRYNDAAYNGDRAVKAAVNRLIGDFVAQDKYVCALCNGVSVLAWARVDGKSPLTGKRDCAPTRQAPSGLYNGQAAQPSCRWHPEVNGAVLSPAGSIGRPGTAEDDVAVDGKIVTGEDDIAAREMGRRIVQLLSQASP